MRNKEARRLYWICFRNPDYNKSWCDPVTETFIWIATEQAQLSWFALSLATPIVLAANSFLDYLLHRLRRDGEEKPFIHTTSST